MYTRRSFIKSTLKATGVVSLSGAATLSLAALPTESRLMVVILRGGMDGLAAVPAIGDNQLKKIRPTLIPDQTLNLDSYFALNPALKFFYECWNKNQCLIVHSTSFSYTGRSHFEGQDIMQSGLDIAYASKTGWIGRAMELAGFEAVAMSLPMPLILRGNQTVDNIFPTRYGLPPVEIYQKLLELWEQDTDFHDISTRLSGLGVRGSNQRNLSTSGQLTLTELGAEAGRQLSKESGPRVAILDHVGFDTHASQGGIDGVHSAKLSDIDAALSAFKSQLGSAWNNTIVMTVTEFGRTAAENGSIGTDHGWGTCAFFAGGKINKSKIIADWPSLKSESLYQGRDLPATIDIRSAYASALSSVFRLDSKLIKEKVINYKPDKRFNDVFN